MATIDDLPKRVRKTAAQHIQDGETILFSLEGNNQQVLVALDDRVLILKPGFVANTMFGCRATTIFYRDITGIQVNTGLITAVLEVSSPSYQAHPADFWQQATRVKDSDSKSPHVLPNCIPTSKKTIQTWTLQIEELRAKITHAKDAAPPQPQINHVEQLRTLGELRDAGLITDEDFDKKKAEILARI